MRPSTSSGTSSEVPFQRRRQNSAYRRQKEKSLALSLLYSCVKLHQRMPIITSFPGLTGESRKSQQSWIPVPVPDPGFRRGYGYHDEVSCSINLAAASQPLGCIPSSVSCILLCLGSWVMLLMDLLQSLPGDMSVDLGCRDIGMAEHDLHGSQIGSVFQEVTCKGMP